MPYIVVVLCDDAEQTRIVNQSVAGVVGVFRYPTPEELTCRGFCTNGNRMSPWKRAKRGHMVCGVCGGRHRETRNRLIGALFDYLGANLKRNPPDAFRTPEGYR